MKLIVSVLCVTMFTACGKRDSKKRNTGIFQGTKQSQPEGQSGSPAVEGQQSLDGGTDISEDPTQEEGDQTVDTDGNPLDFEPRQEGTEGNQTTVTTPAENNDDNSNDDNGDDDSSVDETNPDEPIAVSEPTTSNSGSSNTSNRGNNVPVEKATPTQSGQTASNKATRKDPLSGLGFYEDTPYLSLIHI